MHSKIDTDNRVKGRYRVYLVQEACYHGFIDLEAYSQDEAKRLALDDRQFPNVEWNDCFEYGVAEVVDANAETPQPVLHGPAEFATARPTPGQAWTLFSSLKRKHRTRRRQTMGSAIGSGEGKNVMTKQKSTNQRKQPKRSFARLDRPKALHAAAGAVGLLRTIFKDATKAAGHALELVETELNDILRFSSDSRLPDEIFCDAEAVPIPTDLEQARKAASGAVKVLRKILKDARGDLSVDESQCGGLDDALDRLEESLNILLPPPGAPRKPKLPFYEDEDEAVPVETGSGR